MKQIQLIECGGSVSVPLNHADDQTRRWYGNGSDIAILIHRYEAGDCDTFKWPLDTTYRSLELQRQQMQNALYDCREMGFFPSSVDSATLPDGVTLEF